MSTRLPVAYQSLLSEARVNLRTPVDVESSQVPGSWPDVAIVLMALGAATLLAQVSTSMVAEADLVLIYLVAVSLASIWVHRFWAIVAAIVSVVAFNFFFVPPVGSFAVAHLRYLLTFAVMTVAGLVVSTTATRMRDQAREERERTRRLAVLLDVTRGLTGASTALQLATFAQRSLSELTRGDISIVVWTDDGCVVVGPKTWASGLPEVGGECVPPAEWTAHGDRLKTPILTGDVQVGWALAPEAGWTQESATREVVQAALKLLGAAVERLLLDDRAQRARVEVEVEQTRSDLLSAVSHDLRTPLATIKGAATALLHPGSKLRDAQRRDLLVDIDLEADRLGRMLANLLDVSRLQGGAVAVAGDWHAPEDAIGAALRATRSVLDGRELRTKLPEDVSLLWMDPTLVEQALVNLLENAARHAPVGPILLTVRTEDGGVWFEVADAGPGFGEGDPSRWLGRFERSKHSTGTGLGLAITRAVVELHGGTVRLEQSALGGALAAIFLPTGGPSGFSPPSWEEAEGATDE